jgi:hypothetical protein
MPSWGALRCRHAAAVWSRVSDCSRNAEVWFARDSPLEGAVLSELVSAVGIPCLAGKIQGISSVLASGTRIRRLKNHYDQSLTIKFPTHSNRELIMPYQGIKSGIAGNFSARSGKGVPHTSSP